MPPLRPMSYRRVARKLRAAGFVEESQNGSHVKFVKRGDEGSIVTIVPRHREVSVGTLRAIIRQAGLTPDEFDML